MGYTYNIWEKEEIEQLKSLCDGSKSFVEIGKIMNRTPASCQGQARKWKFDNNYVYRKHNYDTSFFEIPNEKNMFWAGFISADGSLVGHKYHTLQIELSVLDEYFLKQFQEEINYTGTIKYSQRITRNGNLSNLAKLTINCSVLAKNLNEKFNIWPKKAYRLRPPQDISDYLFFYWLKGYICGDGTVFYNKITNNLMINFVSASKDLIVFIKNFIDKYFNQCYRKKENKIRFKQTYSLYSVTGVKACFLFDYLQKLNTPKMDRKWNKPEILDFVKNEIEKYNLQLAQKSLQ